MNYIDQKMITNWRFDADLKIFVGGLSPRYSSSDLYNTFSAYGTISEAVVISSGSYGFVTFKERKSVEMVFCNLPIQSKEGKVLIVKRRHKRQENKRSPTQNTSDLLTRNIQYIKPAKINIDETQKKEEHDRIDPAFDELFADFNWTMNYESNGEKSGVGMNTDGINKGVFPDIDVKFMYECRSAAQGLNGNVAATIIPNNYLMNHTVPGSGVGDANLVPDQRLINPTLIIGATMSHVGWYYINYMNYMNGMNGINGMNIMNGYNLYNGYHDGFNGCNGCNDIA